MRDNSTQTDSNLISMGTVLHNAALESQAVIDAIPLDTDVTDEAVVIEVAIEPVDHLARLILRTPSLSEVGKLVRSRAQAWMDGNYWATLEVAA